MDNLSTAISEFDKYLDSLLLSKKGLQIDMKPLSKISKLSRQLGSQSAISPHTELNRSLFVPDQSGRLQPSAASAQTELLPGGPQPSTSSLVALARETFEDLYVDDASSRPSWQRRTKCSPCFTT